MGEKKQLNANYFGNSRIVLCLKTKYRCQKNIVFFFFHSHFLLLCVLVFACLHAKCSCSIQCSSNGITLLFLYLCIQRNKTKKKQNKIKDQFNRSLYVCIYEHLLTRFVKSDGNEYDLNYLSRTKLDYQ